MNFLSRTSLGAATIFAAVLMPVTGQATQGYFAIGYGAKSMGVAGATVANPTDSIIAASNPAGMSMVGERADVGIRFFSPFRDAELDPRVVGGSFKVKDNSRREFFAIPNLGYTTQVGNNLWAGISIYGNGGMNSTYDRNIYDETSAVLGAFAAAGGGAAGMAAAAAVPRGTGTGTPNTGILGVDLAQVLIAPTLSWKVNENHNVGISLLIGVQRFSARGLGNFQCFTRSVATNPANGAACAAGMPPPVPSNSLTNQGNDYSYGAGVRVGWMGRVSPRVTLGASVASKVYMTELDDYEELFAEEGDFDIPPNVNVGAAFDVTENLNVSVEWQRIFYESVKAISNPGPALGPSIPPGSGPLGADNGLGFGWEDINIGKVGVVYDAGSHWTLRGGVSYNENPIPRDQLLFNILAPAVVQWTATLGFTYSPNDKSEWSMAVMHAFDNSVDADVTAFGVPGEISMNQWSLDLSYGRTF